VEHAGGRPAASDHDLGVAVADELAQLAGGALAQVALDQATAHRVAERVMEERAGHDQGCTADPGQRGSEREGLPGGSQWIDADDDGFGHGRLRESVAVLP
jgi:hypothetical protein